MLLFYHSYSVLIDECDCNGALVGRASWMSLMFNLISYVLVHIVEPILFKLHVYLVCVHMCVYLHIYCCVHKEVRKPLVEESGSLLLPYAFQRLDSDHQHWHQVPLVSKSFCCPIGYVLTFNLKL